MLQNTLKKEVARAAVDYLINHIPPHEIIGIGTGSTVNFFIEAFAAYKVNYLKTVSSSIASTEKLKQYGFEVLDLNKIETLSIYIDGADEITANGAMIKGGGGALTREKILASMAEKFVCIADLSKRVKQLGGFPLPIEVIPIARESIKRKLKQLFNDQMNQNGVISLRQNKDNSPFMTDNSHIILDIKNIEIKDPIALEKEINQWPGVVTVGIFAQRGADMALFASDTGVETVLY